MDLFMEAAKSQNLQGESVSWSPRRAKIIVPAGRLAGVADLSIH
jgi:hypothetical protein